jgi:hypothetical protein
MYIEGRANLFTFLGKSMVEIAKINNQRRDIFPAGVSEGGSELPPS